MLTADSPRAVNSLDDPQKVKLVDLAVNPDGAGRWRIELPAHSVATVQFTA